MIPPQARRHWSASEHSEQILLKRRGTPGEVARWIAQLADPESAWVTGQVIGVDGGLQPT